MRNFPRAGLLWLGWTLVSGLTALQANEPTDAIVLIRTDSGSGTGFVCSMSGTNYIVTNTHVLEAARRYEFTTLQQQKLSGRRLELAQDRDLARILIENSPALPLLAAAKLPAIGDPIRVLGNSQGMNTITELKGKVLGLGPDVVEVDATFVSGNSGSPILDRQNQVVGIATFVAKAGFTNWVNAGTRFDQPRRFGVRLDQVRWIPITLPQFYQESSILRDCEQFLEDGARLTRYLRQQQLEQLVEFAASRRGNQPALYADAQYANMIANFGQSLQTAAAAARQGLSVRSGQAGVALQMAESAFQRFPDIPLAKLKQTRWSTAHYQKKASELEQVFVRWKKATKQ